MSVYFTGYHFNGSFGQTNAFAAGRRAERLGTGQDKQMKNGSIFAGNLKQSVDPIMQRKKFAQKKALKLVSDAWDGDKKLDSEQEARRQRIKELQGNNKENIDIIKGYQEYGEQLREQYGVDPDSQEQKDLELMLKGAGADLSEEERKRLEELSGQPLTEYQKRILDMQDSIGIYQKEIDEANKEIKDLSAVIEGVKQERLKDHHMADAQKDADEIMRNAAKEAAFALAMEAKDHIDEEMEEEREKAKEKAEKKEEQDEKLEEKKLEREEKEEALEKQREELRLDREAREEQRKEAREQAKEQEELLEQVAPFRSASVDTPSQMKTEIKTMLRKMKLLEEDIKGTQVDDTV